MYFSNHLTWPIDDDALHIGVPAYHVRQRKTLFIFRQSQQFLFKSIVRAQMIRRGIQNPSDI